MLNLITVAKDKERCADLMGVIDWKISGIQRCGGFSDLDAALVFCRQNLPDLILIEPWGNMEDALEFCRAVIRQSPVAKTILVGGEENFLHVQRALNIGVFAYLSAGKNGAEEFARILERVRERQYIEQHSRHIVRRQLLRDILKGKKATDAEIEAYFGIKPSPRTRYVFLLLRKDRPYPIMEVKPDIDYYAVRWHTTALPEQFSYIATVNLEMETWGMLLRTDAGLSRHQLFVQSYSVACSMQSAYEEQCMNTVSIAISDEVSDLAQLVSWTRCLQKRLEHSVYYGRRKIYTNQMERVEEKSSTDLIDEDIETLRRHIKSDNLQSIAQSVSAIFSEFEQNIARCVDLRYLCDQLLSCLEAFRAKNYLETMLRRQEKGECDFSQCHTISDIREWFAREFETAYFESHNYLDSQYSDKVTDIIKFIRKNYRENCSLQEIAEMMSISSDYLRHIFKKDTGQSLQKFVTSVKIENAKRMLEEGDRKTAEIASDLGFNTAQYFCSVFRKMTGMSPTEYATQHRKEVNSGRKDARNL